MMLSVCQILLLVASGLSHPLWDSFGSQLDDILTRGYNPPPIELPRRSIMFTFPVSEVGSYAVIPHELRIKEDEQVLNLLELGNEIANKLEEGQFDVNLPDGSRIAEVTTVVDQSYTTESELKDEKEVGINDDDSTPANSRDDDAIMTQTENEAQVNDDTATPTNPETTTIQDMSTTEENIETES